MKYDPRTIKFIFFGTPTIATRVLDTLLENDLMPSLIVTNPDRPRGRGMAQAKPPVKTWAVAHDIPVLQPETFDEATLSRLRAANADFFLVVAYGKILPQTLLDIPRHGTLNIHGSLLPAYRGAAPVEAAILAGEKKTGVTVMLVDEQMDHGPILGERAIYIDEHTTSSLKEEMGIIGAELVAAILPDWLSGTLKPIPQNHDAATYTKKIKKEDGLLDMSAAPEENLRKIRAFDGWPGTYFYAEKNGTRVRVSVIAAEIRDGALVITRATPEGKKGMNEQEFKNWMRS